MELLADHLLKPYTTFKIGGPARYFAEIREYNDLTQALEFAASNRIETFVLGGGSNVLISDRGLDALVLHPALTGITVAEEAQRVFVRSEAGEPWDQLVAHAVERNWWGIENLSHIPGQSGAALVQNIGAYGQQISDVLESAEVADLRSGAISRLSAAQCSLAYRKSIFNSSHRGCYFILNLTLRLSRHPHPNLEYPGVKTWFKGLGNRQPSLAQIRQAIIAIRDAKFPYPREEKGGNAGSFFKNLNLNQEEYQALERRFQDHFGPDQLMRLREIRQRSAASDSIRIPTAFLLEACGLKGYRVGAVSVNERQPLVLLNEGGATARDVLLLARHIRQTVFTLTGVKIAIEPELVGFTDSERAELIDSQA
ncbi:MAG TPA: UDP-N-acetylmuramate dehydrogenase [Terriglobia bacterium]|nr:UDP-N-acetylmuramate dehydrogenase [Terriglobia bacterium]